MSNKDFYGLKDIKCPIHQETMQVLSMNLNNAMDTPLSGRDVFPSVENEILVVERHFELKCPYGCKFDYMIRDLLTYDNFKVKKEDKMKKELIEFSPTKEQGLFFLEGCINEVKAMTPKRYADLYKFIIEQRKNEHENSSEVKEAIKLVMTKFSEMSREELIEHFGLKKEKFLTEIEFDTDDLEKQVSPRRCPFGKDCRVYSVSCTECKGFIEAFVGEKDKKKLIVSCYGGTE
jgi:hypothetical protein